MAPRFPKYVPLPLFGSLDALHQLTYKKVKLPPYFADYGLPNTALNDFKMAAAFLYTYRGSNETFKSYRSEIERLLQWASFICEKSLTKLTREDIEAFLHFCQNPPKHWIVDAHVWRIRDGKPNPKWRPFVLPRIIKKFPHEIQENPEKAKYFLSESSTRNIFCVLSSFYTYLVEEDYARLNPVARIRQKSKYLRKYQTKRQVKRLSSLQWRYVLEAAELMARNNPEVHERTLFVLSALFCMYLRISELGASDRWVPQMNNFFKDRYGHWWFKTVGKGNKERDICVSDDMLHALRRYRRHLCLSDYPAPYETTPLVPKHRGGRGPIRGTRHIRKLVQGCFDQAMERLLKDGLREESDALKAVTVHWLRHTGISEDVKIRPREHVRDDAGHSSSAITDRYIDIELQERHASARNKRIKFGDEEAQSVA